MPARGKQEAAPAPVEVINYVTDTVTTPANKGKAPGRTRAQSKPMSISSLPGFAEAAARATSSSASALPKWARANSVSSMSGVFAPASDQDNQDGTPTSRASSLTSSVAPAAPTRSMGTLPKHDSNVSFRWVPENVCVQSHHRKLSEKYFDCNMVNTIGEGRNATVFIVQHRESAHYYACKVLNKADQDAETMRSEIKMLKMLDHPNIIRLHESVEDSEHVFLLMELCHGGDLFSRIADEGHLSEKVACVFAEQILRALAYCHSKEVVHRDVKPENFLLETDDPECLTLKLADFGISTSMRFPKSTDQGGHEVNGSIPYMAPEMFQKQWKNLIRESGGSREYLGASDLWSAGVVIYVMLSGDLPYGDCPEIICSGEPPTFASAVWQDVSVEAVDLIRKLLNPSIKDRWTAPQALKHEWIRGAPSGAASEEDPGTADSRRLLARSVLHCLRRWKRTPKLRRAAITAIGGRLEADHSALRFAQRAYRTFNPGYDALKCDAFIQALNNALCEGIATPAANTAPAQTTASPAHAREHECGAGSASSSSSRQGSFSSDAMGSETSPTTRSITGFHVRQKVQNFYTGLTKRALTRVLEETPRAGGSPVSQSPEIGSIDSEDLVSIKELKDLVGSLDGVKNGMVDYTLLVASCLPPDVYRDEARIVEAFDQFDISKQGFISAKDLQTTMRAGVKSKDRAMDLRLFTEMVSEFDLNGDGVLDGAEFRAMLCASNDNFVDGCDQTRTPMTDGVPTPSTSRA